MVPWFCRHIGIKIELFATGGQILLVKGVHTHPSVEIEVSRMTIDILNRTGRWRNIEIFPTNGEFSVSHRREGMTYAHRNVVVHINVRVVCTLHIPITRDIESVVSKLHIQKVIALNTKKSAVSNPDPKILRHRYLKVGQRYMFEYISYLIIQ